MDPWQVLGINPTNDVRAIKRAYSVKLKQHRPDKDPEGYQVVRDAFEMAKGQATRSPVARPAPEPRPPVTADPEQGSADQQETTLTETPEATAATSPVPVLTETVDEAAQELDAGAESGVEDPAETIVELIRAIHQTIISDGEVAGFRHFQAVRRHEILVPLDAAQWFEFEMLDYLQWLYEKQEWLPVGFARQVFREFRWHEAGYFDQQRHDFLLKLYEIACADSAWAYVNRLANNTPVVNVEDRYRKRAAEMFLGDVKPLRFWFNYLRSGPRGTARRLAQTIIEARDGTLEFELDTPGMHWWLKRQNHFAPDITMIAVGFMLAIVPAILTGTAPAMLPVLNLVPSPLIYTLLIALYTIPCSAIVYAACFCVDKIRYWSAELRKLLDVLLVQSELYRAIPALGVSTVVFILLSRHLVDDPVAIVTFWLLLMAWLYKLQAIALVVGTLVFGVGLDLAVGPGAHLEASGITYLCAAIAAHWVLNRIQRQQGEFEHSDLEWKWQHALFYLAFCLMAAFIYSPFHASLATGAST